MDINLISAEDVRAKLAPLSLKQIDRLAALSAVPAPTIYKIRLGVTANPGIETVGLFWPFIDEVLAEAKTVTP